MSKRTILGLLPALTCIFNGSNARMWDNYQARAFGQDEIQNHHRASHRVRAESFIPLEKDSVWRTRQRAGHAGMSVASSRVDDTIGSESMRLSQLDLFTFGISFVGRISRMAIK